MQFAAMRNIGFSVLLAPLVALSSACGPALAAQSAWSQADQSRLRLVAAPMPEGGMAAAVEIQLEEGWHTYWRTPGDVGIPPQLDFSASQNLASVEVLYPAPERYEDGRSVSAVYFDGVVLPLKLQPEDAKRPITLRLSAFYGVCEEVCIPAEGDAELVIAPEPEEDVRSRILIATALDRLPVESPSGGLAIGAVRLEGETAHIDVTAQGARQPPSLFAEGPEEWFLSLPEHLGSEGATHRYRLSLAGRPQGATLSGARLGLTAVSGGTAVESEVRLP